MGIAQGETGGHCVVAADQIALPAWDVGGGPDRAAHGGLGGACAARAVHPGPLSSCVSALFLGSGVLALAGLTGVVLNDMQVRNIGVFGYVGVFTVAVFVYVLHLRRSLVADWEQA